MDESFMHPSSRSQQFDPQTGWFTGSMDGLTRLLSANGSIVKKTSHASPQSPDLVRPSSSDLAIDADAVNSYLRRYEGTDVMDY